MEKAETEMWLEVGEKVFWTLKMKNRSTKGKQEKIITKLLMRYDSKKTRKNVHLELSFQALSNQTELVIIEEV